MSVLDPGAAALFRGMRAGFKLDPILRVSEWADRFRLLQAETTRQHGRWRTDRTPYLREIMDCLSAHSAVQRLVLMKGAQIGGTEALLNWLGYIIHNAPGPTMVVYPTIESAEDQSKDRISPMLTATPELAELVRENKARGSGNTILEKKFRGGMLKISGANSAVMLRSKPIRYLCFDEVDGFPADVDGEGDPIALAEARTNTFSSNRKIAMVSTPKIKGFSRIEAEYLASDQRRYFIPCPECGHMDFLTWQTVGHHQIQFDPLVPAAAHMVCSGCGAHVEERHKNMMFAAGEWRPTAVGASGVRGYHISGLYSPLGWFSWAEAASAFVKAKENPVLLKVWVNTCLGETWEEKAESVDPDALLARAHEYAAEVPDGVGVLVASVDVQADRLEWKVKGYGADEQSWLIAYGAIPGDPSTEKIWFQLDELVLNQTFTHQSGHLLKIECMAVDAAFNSDMVYRYCKARLARRVFAVRGDTAAGKPLVGRPSANNAYRTRLYMLCVNSGKDTVFARLRIGAPGPGFMNMPRWIDREYVDQLTAERSFRKYVKGKGSFRVWEKVRDRNEALDLEVYALAALYIMGPRFVRGLAARATRLAQRVAGAAAGKGEAPPEPEAPPAPEPPAPPRAGWQTQIRPNKWVTGWKK